ncbi:MAG: M48 family metallopeptidase [Candidatus Binatia bacterium]
MVKKGSLPLVLFLSLLMGCVTTPYTQRSQVMLVSESQEIEMGKEAYRQILRDSVLSHDREALRIVRRVGRRIARAANKPIYKWEFNVVNDPETVNAFAVPGGKVAVYTGIFKAARDEAGLAVVLGHEVAHALARHAGERMSQGMLVQLGGVGLSAALGSRSQLGNQVLQAYGLGTGVGLILPFGRAQESEADRIGLILMAKAGYDPRAALAVWERMRKQEAGKQGSGSPPEFLSTHPGYKTRTAQLRAFIPKALTYYHRGGERLAQLPSPQALDSAMARATRELLKGMQLVNAKTQDPQNEKRVVEALGSFLRMNPSFLYQERQKAQLGYGQYAALRGVTYFGRTSMRRVLANYQRGSSWGELTRSHGVRITELTSLMRRLLRTIAPPQVRSPYRYRAPRFP